jgi:hypothetical protein
MDRTTAPDSRLLIPLDLFQYWYQQELNANFGGYCMPDDSPFSVDERFEQFKT